MKKEGIIYKVTGPTLKVYIGKTVQSLHRRRICHNSNAFNDKVKHYNCHLYKAIRKYGIDSFEWEVMYSNIPEDNLSQLEQDTISEYDSVVSGYNSTYGGEGSSGFKHSEESKKKMSESSKGQVVSNETRKKLSEMRKGKKKSKEHIEKIKNSNLVAKFNQFKHMYKNFYAIKGKRIVGEWLAPAKCARDLELESSLIWKCLKGERKHHKGYFFVYVSEYE